MITANIISRTFYIKYKDNAGTCFTIDIEGKQYFVTAKHVISDLKSGDNIQLFHQRRWNILKAKLIGHSTHSDISVFSIEVLIQNHPLLAGSGGIIYGQDLYFLGFPYGLFSEAAQLNREFPVPLVKKGILSAAFLDQPGKHFFLDGHNNPGFSGGPVVFRENSNDNFKVAAVISSYRYEMEATFIDNVPTRIQYQYNTGIIVAYTIENALDLINSNPIGRALI